MGQGQFTFLVVSSVHHNTPGSYWAANSACIKAYPRLSISTFYLRVRFYICVYTCLQFSLTSYLGDAEKRFHNGNEQETSRFSPLTFSCWVLFNPLFFKYRGYPNILTLQQLCSSCTNPFPAELLQKKEFISHQQGEDQGKIKRE